jgi:putative ATP-dependent endonuclease of the OLD family
MRIEKAKITNFRMLEDVEISLESDTTVIVGRNNSGKTSLTEVFDRLIGEKAAAFKIEDFSAGSRHKFLDAKKLKDEGFSFRRRLSYTSLNLRHADATLRS